jgi:uncharacterized membrane protein
MSIFIQELLMTTPSLTASALATVLALGLGAAGGAHAAEGKEKCYGIVKAGANDCANLNGSHSCAGQAKTDMAPEEWKYVAKGSCKSLKGLTSDEAKLALVAKR